MTPKASKVSLFGPGALGSTLIRFLIKHPETYQLQSVWGSDASNSFLFEDGVRYNAHSSFPEKISELGSTVFITTPDHVISEIADRISRMSNDWSGYKFIHFSGNQNSAVLHKLALKGAYTASLHPLQTFTKGDQEDRFRNIWFTFEGDERLFPELEVFVSRTGAHLKKINAEQKKALHLAAVMASNYMVSLMDAVREVTNLYKIEDGVAMLEPLIHQTAQNIFGKGIPNSLSGPVARGDIETIKSHLNQIENKPELTTLYTLLGSRAADIALSNRSLDAEHHQEIKKLFSEKS